MKLTDPPTKEEFSDRMAWGTCALFLLVGIIVFLALCLRFPIIIVGIIGIVLALSLCYFLGFKLEQWNKNKKETKK
jgi:mannose/fructose/N-acetylgalactosamine-specific phosphotransferase system component IIC